MVKFTSALAVPANCWRFLAGHAEELDLRLIDFRGGTLRNAIPREAFATSPLRRQRRAENISERLPGYLKNELAEEKPDAATQ